MDVRLVLRPTSGTVRCPERLLMPSPPLLGPLLVLFLIGLLLLPSPATFADSSPQPFDRHTGVDLSRSQSGDILLTASAASFATSSSAAINTKPLRIGLLAGGSRSETLQTLRQHWQSTLAYLQRELAPTPIIQVDLNAENLGRALKLQAVDLLLTTPTHLQLYRDYPQLQPLARMTRLVSGQRVGRFGGVIFSRSGHPWLNSVASLDSPRHQPVVIAGQANSSHSDLLQRWTLHRLGIELDAAAQHYRFIDLPDNKIISNVIAGKADLGFVASGVIERMVREGKLNRSQLRVLNRRPSLDYPQLLSTDLYAFWPLAALPHLKQQDRQQLVGLLAAISPISAPARDADYYSFEAIPDNRVDPNLFKSPPPPRTELDRSRQPDDATAWTWFLSLLMLFGGVLLLLWRQHRINTHLKQAIHKLHRHETLLNRLAEGVYCINELGQTVYINQAALRMLGYSQDQVEGRNSHALFHHSHPDGSAYPPEHCPVHQSLQDGQPRQAEDWFIHRDGTPFPVALKTTRVQFGLEINLVVVFSDISERQALIQQLDNQRVMMQNVIDATPDLIFFKNLDSVYLGCNGAFVDFTGRNLQQIIGQSDFELFDQETARRFRQIDRQTLEQATPQKHEEWVTYPNGQQVLLETVKTPFYDSDGGLMGLVGVSRDVTERKQVEQQYAQMAFFDPLTQLPNRRLLMDRVNRVLADCIRHQHYAALLMIDLDNFKQINDNEGHDAGDDVLKRVASLLVMAVRETDTVARLGGDEFVVVLDELGNHADSACDNAVRIAEIILEKLQTPHLINNTAYHTTPSIGVALFRDRPESTEQLFKQADRAMYRAKAHGRNRYEVYQPPRREQ